jgi:hypothetical protein
VKREAPEKIDPEIEKRCEDVIAQAFRGAYHCSGWSRRKAWGDGIKVSCCQDLSTCDFDILTRLVIAAHDNAVRVRIMQGGAWGVSIGLTPRKREGDIFESHPTIEAAIERMRKNPR